MTTKSKKKKAIIKAVTFFVDLDDEDTGVEPKFPPTAILAEKEKHKKNRKNHAVAEGYITGVFCSWKTILKAKKSHP
jgi:hypothetical protein